MTSKHARRAGRGKSRARLKRIVKDYALPALALAAVAVGVAGASAVAYNAHQTRAAADAAYHDPDVSDLWTHRGEMRKMPVISTAEFKGIPITIVDWVYDQDRFRSTFDAAAPITEAQLETLCKAWGDKSARLITFVRHPFSCANEASKDSWYSNLQDGMHKWWFSDPPATPAGLLQSIRARQKRVLKRPTTGSALRLEKEWLRRRHIYS